MSSPQNSGSVQGGITASAGVVSVIVANYADVAIQLAGTFVGTVQFEVTINNDTWAALSLTPSGGGSPVTSATDVGTWQGACGGYYAVRVRCSAFTSGPIYVAINASTMRAGASVVQVDAGLSGTGTIGDPLSANVDGTTIDVNGSNQLEALGAAVAFKTIAVSGQSNIVADAADDTLTIVAGSNITLTTNAGTDTLTIAASGGGGTPGGADTQVQFNDSDAFGGDAALTFDKATQTFTAGPTATHGQGQIQAAAGSATMTYTDAGGFQAQVYVSGDIPDFASTAIQLLTQTAAGNTAINVGGETVPGSIAFDTPNHNQILLIKDDGTVTVDGTIKATTYKSSDGSSGVSAGPFTSITAITVKNGLITSITGS